MRKAVPGLSKAKAGGEGFEINSRISLRSIRADLLQTGAARAAHLPFMFIATDQNGRTSRLAIISLVVATYFLK
jgi:hypothetical protein